MKQLIEFDPEKQNNAKDFYGFNVNAFQQLLISKKADFWINLGETRALKLFHRAANTIPAYKDFLRKNKVKSSSVKTIEDFSKVPKTTKENYLDKYPLDKKNWNGQLSNEGIIAVSSGTSGKPRIWPRSNFQEFEAAVIHELLFSEFFAISEHSTLLIIGLPLGIYVSGIATTLPSWLISNKNKYRLTIASVGNKKDELINVVESVGKYYDQIIIAGHPFFIKDVIENINIRKKLKNTKVRFLFTSQGYSETWRKYVLSKVNSVYSPFDAINLYGSTDALVTAFETPQTIKIKQKIEKEKSLRDKLNIYFQMNLFQYIPAFRYLETEKENLLITSYSGIPLVRFDVGDRAEIVKFNDMRRILGKRASELKSKNIVWQLPYIILKGRANYAVEFHVAHVKPEYIGYALDRPAFHTKLTGKFFIKKYEDKKADTQLVIYIELKRGQTGGVVLKEKIKKEVEQILRKCDYRYDFLFTSQRQSSHIKIYLCDYQDEKYFKQGVKPKFIQ